MDKEWLVGLEVDLHTLIASLVGNPRTDPKIVTAKSTARIVAFETARVFVSQLVREAE